MQKIDLERVRELLRKFDEGEPVDDAEELLEEIPTWLEMIEALVCENENLRNQKGTT